MRAIFVEPNPFNPLIPIQILITKDMSFREEWQSFTLTKRRYEAELSRVGLELVDHSYILPLLPPQLFNRLIPYLKRYPKPLSLAEAVGNYLVFPSAYQILLVR
jgi:hypothetical protein